MRAGDRGDGPGALEEEGGEELGDLAVAAEDEDVTRSRHFGDLKSSMLSIDWVV